MVALPIDRLQFVKQIRRGLPLLSNHRFLRQIHPSIH
eukprot:SAG11_NODE_15102_length_589_cov_0.775510_1_plen_36_part_10